jgi:hypothetical protein
MILSIYFIIGIVILVMSFSNMINFIKFFNIRNWALTFKRVTNKDVESKDFRTREDYNIFTIYSVFLFFEIIWLVFGIATSNWYMFLSLIILGLIVNFISKYSKFLLLSKIIGTIFSCLKFCLILFLILNHFHFHLDLLSLLR